MPLTGLSFSHVTFLNVAPRIRQSSGWIATRIVALTLSVKKTYGKTLVNFSPVTREILWLICIGSNCREANICPGLVLVKGHPLGSSSIASL